VAIIARGNADGSFERSVATDEFSDFSDGTRRGFRGVDLFSNGGAAVPVKYALSFD
jgi:hypothetical protein